MTAGQQKNSHLPDFLKGFFWSYDLDRLNLQRDFKRIATNIMIYGDLKAIRWLFAQYTIDQLKDALTDPLRGEWDAKSLAFWSGYLNVKVNKVKALKSI